MTLEHAPTLIGLTGPNGAGKDTAAEMLAGKLTREGRSTVVMAFADALYEEVSAAFFLNPLHLKDRATKEQPLQQLSLTYCGDQQFAQVVQQQTGCTAYTPHSPRQILQWWGTEYRRAQQPDYWVQRLLAKVQQHREAGVQHIIVTDVRFADEAAAIRTQGGQIWRIHRPNYTPAGTGHVSEVTGEEFAPEVTIRNEGTMELLRIYLLQALHRADSKHKEAQWQSSEH
ncbi:hypothetical protein [Comamonas kerstersii]|uniref:deoxynucleotide monophosphate kinase family protein n=1 Tax=Comamonas kerstersii TaxID=225992 RepID=UPI001B345369|nr:hypothetical protein [Comamonas kerstersii]QTW18209.1 hypothetical protein H8N02_13620 [Comamonas kerstersii]